MLRTLCAPMMEFKLDDGQPGRFKGYGSTFGNVDLGKDICVAGCFARSLKEHKAANTLPAMYWMHDRTEPVGDWLDMGEDAKGLYVEGQVWRGDAETECSRKALNLMKGTGPKGMSIGYQTKASTYDPKTGIRSLKDVDLLEVSVVGYGMNPKALVTHVKTILEDGAMPSVRDVEEILRDAGFSAQQAKAFIAHGLKAVERDADREQTMQEEIREILAIRAALRCE